MLQHTMILSEKRTEMVQTRRKTAAAAHDGAVKENKTEPPASQMPPKKGKRGRPPKIRTEALTLSNPSTSGSIDASNLMKEVKLKDETLFIKCESQESDSLMTNEADSFLEKEEANEDKKVLETIPQQNTSSPDKSNASTIPPPPLLSKRRSSTRLKIKHEEEDVQSVGAAPKENEIKPGRHESTSPVHPDDPQHSDMFSIDETKHEPVEFTKEMKSTSTPSSKLSNSGEESISRKPSGGINSKSIIAPNVDEPESMDIADSESESETDEPCVADTDMCDTSSSSIPLPESSPPNKFNKEEIHVETEQKLTWDKNEASNNPLSSPTMSRPKIHFLHPAYSSFASDPSTVSPQPPPHPESASSREKNENGFSMAFKMTFKKATNNPLLKTSALDQPPSPPTSSSISSTSVSEAPLSGIASSISPPKRSSNFGQATSNEIPPPQMVELPQLSFFNMPSTTNSAVSGESDSASEDQISQKSITPVPSATPTKITESKIQAVKAAVEKAAQDIARRHLEERQKEDRTINEKRRDSRDRRYKKTDSDRSEQSSRARQREDDERRAREREREVTKRHDREREEERNQKQKDEDRRKREEEDRRNKEEEDKREKEADEKRQKEEEMKKEDEKKMKEEEMKIPNFELITESKYLTRNANKKKTESLICECHRTGGNCSDNTCVNRAMLTECPSSCPAKCKNQRFAKKKYASVEPFHTGTPKGCGLRALKDIKKGRFIIEYIGEVVERDDYEKRKTKYAADKKHKHHYLCDTGIYTIDATVYGNASRFVNHSCDPNAICEKWSVPRTPGDVNRIGFFSKRLIKAGEEITFDYQFVNYGRDAQQCHCGSASCNGWIGQKPEEYSSDEEDEDIVITRHINMDEEEEEKLEELNDLEPHERIDLINEMLEDLVIRNKKHARKVITIATRITDHAQRENLLKEVFSADTSLGTQTFYAKEGMATLMAEWLEADDYSLDNLKLVQVILQTLHGDVFVSCAKSDRLLLEMLARWLNASLGDWVDLHVITDSLITCTVEPQKEYQSVCDATEKEIIANFKRVKEMAFRLNHHWFNRSVSFKIPKKVREPITKEVVGRQEDTPSSQYHENNRSGAESPIHQRHHHSSHSSSYYNERESHPRFFNNGNDVHQYRFTGYHGNNYKANYFPRRPTKDSYRDRRRFGGGRRSRSRSRSISPQNNKRRKYDERENHRTRSPAYERRAASPGEKTPGSNTSADRSYGRSEVRGSVEVKTSVENKDTPVAQAYPILEHQVAHPHEHPAVHPHEHSAAHPGPYPMPGYEGYGMYGAGMYMFHPGYYQAAYSQPPVSTMETLLSPEWFSNLYEKVASEQLMNRLNIIKEETVIIHKLLDERHKEEVRLAAEEEARRQEALAQPKYVWAVAKSDTGEKYYYNKITKETQWAEPTADQGLLEPEDGTSPVVTAATSEDQRVGEEYGIEEQSEMQEMIMPVIKEELVKQEQLYDTQEEQQLLQQQGAIASVSIDKSTTSPKSSRDRDRDRREGSRHRDHNSKNGHRESSTSERRVRDFKQDLERSIRSVVRSHSRLRHLREATSDRITWLIKLIAKEMYKRESSQNGFDFRFSENTDKKVKNYTKSLIDRKLESNDLWKGYCGR